MIRSTVFKSNKSQAVRLPKPVAMPDGVHKVEIVKLGKARLIAPVGTLWDSFFAGDAAEKDFMEGREQPAMADRDPL